MASETGNWCLIESDPGVFTELISQMGVKDVQVEELYSLDSGTLHNLEPVYGLIFLFKWVPGAKGNTDSNSDSEKEAAVGDNGNVYFMQQVIQNACATQAILSILLNKDKDINDIGDTLRGFKEFSHDLPPDIRGLALGNSDQIREVHNSFARSDPFVSDFSKPADEDDDVFHFISYVPINGHLYELDGLKSGPIDHGVTDDWLNVVEEVIQKRMSQYSANEIRFNLMAVVGDRRKQYNEKIINVDADIARLLSRLESLRIDNNNSEESKAECESIELQIGELNNELDELKYRVEVENGKFQRYKFDNTLRKHNFIPLIYHLARGLAAKEKLGPALEAAKSNARSRPSGSE